MAKGATTTSSRTMAPLTSWLVRSLPSKVSTMAMTVTTGMTATARRNSARCT